jgi:hypothetical protein
MTQAIKSRNRGIDSNPHIGTSFDDFLVEEGLLADCQYQALKEMLADQLRRAMADERLSKAAMARRMNTSRRQLDRLLEPNGENITLATMSKAARAVGRKLQIELV